MGGLVRRGPRRLRPGRRCSRTRRAASTTAAASSSSRCPASHDAATVAGTRAFWLRCRLDDTTRAGAPAATFSHPPEIYSITAAPLGALVPAAHSVAIEEEQIAESDGTPGQVFRLRNAPVLALEGDEGLEVLEPESTNWRRWDLRESFAESGPSDPHYTLDLASGEVQLGPAIRTGDGAWRQYGMVPPEGRAAADGRLPPRRRPPRQRGGGGPHAC